ncbi:purine-binding chemotaxis protein CheW [Anaerobacterium chartisolvens]|uniref:Purine-binding chemotaxis protein CheW n=1 Tax=Anaerobacterium chartisolvens TaxID=1297424 RepID=A0A369B4U5_9FIRM|nr:chemotaxis protein CheW [Anaerobacterium chartisolvens]RCX15536.1 purine-binding chemotaxis protein CheW [Anaerobacterium chartisolvens]
MELSSNTDVRQYVVFKLGQDEYGVDIQKVTTIEQVKPIARVPRTPDYIKGVLNLRGDIIPIMDLRKRFNLPVEPDTEDTRIIIIKIEEISIGIIVDSVAEVMNLTEADIENVTNFTTEFSLDYIMGVGKADGRIVTLLNMEKLIKLEDNL